MRTWLTSIGSLTQPVSGRLLHDPRRYDGSRRIPALRRPRFPTQFAAHQAAICGVTRAEILHGVRNPAVHARFAAALNGFQQVSIPDALWDEVGSHLAALRAAGLPTPFADVIIAALAIHLGVELWSGDQHHVAMQAVVPMLRLFQEPP